MSFPVTADLLLRVRRHAFDPFVAVVEVPDGVTLDESSVLTDASGRTYEPMGGAAFARLAETAPFSMRRYFAMGPEVHVLPPDATLLHLTL